MRLKPKPIKSISGSYPLRVSGIMSGGSKELVSDVPGGRHFLKDLEEEDGYRGKFKRRRFSIATSVRPSSPFDKPSSDWNDTENVSQIESIIRLASFTTHVGVSSDDICVLFR